MNRVARPPRVRKPAKYEPGAELSGFDELAELHRQYINEYQDIFVWQDMHWWRTEDDGSRTISGRGRPLHIAMAFNLPVSLAYNQIKSGRLRRADVTQAYKDWLSKEYATVFRTAGLLERAA